MKKPESYLAFFTLFGVILLSPLFTQAIAQLWWGFGVVPVLPLIFLVAFFKLSSRQYLVVSLIGGWWYDVTTGALGPVGLLSAVTISAVLYAIAQLIASRSLLSDMFTATLLYVVWLCVLFVINIIVLRITPMTPAVVISTDSVVVGLVGVWLMQLGLRRVVLKNAVVPKALL